MTLPNQKVRRSEMRSEMTSSASVGSGDNTRHTSINLNGTPDVIYKQTGINWFGSTASLFNLQ